MVAVAMTSDIERGGAAAGGKGRSATGYYGAVNGAAGPSPFYYDAGSSAEREWTPWIVPMIVVANVLMFVVIMYVNNCPDHANPCVARFLHRFSFQPLRENPLFGPSSST